MKIPEVNSFEDFHKAVFILKDIYNTRGNENWIFRGQAEAWPLKPEIGREPFSYFIKRETAIFKNWLNHARIYVKEYGQANEWDLVYRKTS